MKKQLIIVGIIVLLITVGLSGCSEESKTVFLNIGDSITVEKIKYTFLSADWTESWGAYTYNLKIKGENLANEEVTGYVALLKYEMKNGYMYEHSEMFGTSIGTKFTINPGKEQIQTFTSSGEIDRDFLPVAKIHLDIRKSSNGYSYEYLKSIVLNV